MVWGEFRSDNISVGRNIQQDGSLEKVLKENIDAKNTYTDWSGFYEVINRCNTVIKYAPGVAEVDPAYTQSELQANIAEMVALRSLSYFYLIRTFRDVPFSREAYTDDDQKMDLPATKFDAVVDSLIDDLESVKNNAVKRYPVTKPLYQTGRVTQDFIHALLCELYLWKKDYQNCIRYADMVIAAKKVIYEENRLQKTSSTISQTNDVEEKYNGYPLVSNSSQVNYFGDAYDTLFGYDNDNQDELNQEIAFRHVELCYLLKVESGAQIPDELEDLMIDEDELDKNQLIEEINNYWSDFKFKNREQEYGTVKKYFEDKNFGFIINNKDESIFFHKNEFKGDNVYVGQLVSFYTEKSFDKSKNEESLKAVCIRGE